MGYPSGEIPMLDVHGQAVAGATFAVPIWHEYMAAALNHFLDVSHTGCAILDPTTFASGRPVAVRVDVYERNQEYSGGGQAWTPLYERDLLAKLGSKGYYLLKDNDVLAKKRKQPWLAGEEIMLLVDRRTQGQRKVILGFDFDEDTWIVFSVLGGPRNALDVASLISRGVLGR